MSEAVTVQLGCLKVTRMSEPMFLIVCVNGGFHMGCTAAGAEDTSAPAARPLDAYKCSFAATKYVIVLHSLQGHFKLTSWSFL